jgi:hypothetical protein
MELVSKAEFWIFTRASQGWIPELITAAGPEVTETYGGAAVSKIRFWKRCYGPPFSG